MPVCKQWTGNGIDTSRCGPLFMSSRPEERLGHTSNALLLMEAAQLASQHTYPVLQDASANTLPRLKLHACRMEIPWFDRSSFGRHFCQLNIRELSTDLELVIAVDADCGVASRVDLDAV